MEDVMDEQNIVGGEHVDPSASPEARKFILTARAFMYSDEMAEALDRTIRGSGDYLADGAVPFIAQLVQALEQKLGELNPDDLYAVVAHLAGSIVDLAAKLGDPDTANSREAVMDITEGVLAVLSGELDGMAQQGQGDTQGAPMDAGPAPLLESAHG